MNDVLCLFSEDHNQKSELALDIPKIVALYRELLTAEFKGKLIWQHLNDNMFQTERDMFAEVFNTYIDML